MRIAMIAPFGVRPYGTVIHRMIPMARALKKHEFFIIIPPLYDPENSEEKSVQENVRLINVRSCQIPLLRFIIMAFWMIRQCQLLKTDLIHVFKPKGVSGLVAIFFILLGSKPVILDMDDWEGTGGWNEVLKYSWLIKRLIDFQERWIPRHCSAVTVASNQLYSRALGFGVESKRIFYVPNGVDMHKFTLEKEPGRNDIKVKNRSDLPLVLLYTRFFEYDLGTLISIFKKILRKIDVVLLVVGKGFYDEENQLMKLIRSNNISHRVIYKGWVGMDEIARIMSASDVAVYPMRDDNINRAKCPVKLTDLLAFGVPVVANDVGQVREYIVDFETGVLVKPGDDEGFAEAVINVLRNTDLRERLGRNAKENMFKNYPWNVLVNKIESAYLQVLNLDEKTV